MNKLLLPATLTLALLLCAGTALAWHVVGNVHCSDTGGPLANALVIVNSTDSGPAFSGQATTDENGNYSVTLPEFPQCFNETVVLPSGNTLISPVSGSFDFCTDDINNLITNDFVYNGPSCSQQACWLTAGGGKFEPVDKLLSGVNGPDDSWGGNVYPGCSSTAGDGGSWNHVAHSLKLHFHGQTIQVVRCGNIDGIPPGSTSPATPFNYIDFTGTGTLKGIQGNKANYGTVYFFAHCEDRNEPGSAGQRDGAGKDRYFLNVYSDQNDPVGSSLLLEDVDGNPATMDPVTITDGNMQIHITSCATPVVAAQTAPTTRTGFTAPATGSASGVLSFAVPSPSPAQSRTLLSFSLPKAASVSMAAFDVSGRQVRLFSSGTLSPGTHSFDWSLRNDNGQPLRAGVYFVRLTVGGQVLTRPVVITP